MDLSANIASLAAALMGPQLGAQGGTGNTGVAGPAGMSDFQKAARRNYASASARPPNNGAGTPVANSIIQARQAAAANPFQSQNENLGGYGTGQLAPALTGMRRYEDGTPAGGMTSEPMQGQQAGRAVQPDLASPLTQALGLDAAHTPILQALLQADPTGKTALMYAQHAGAAKQGQSKSALEDAQAFEANQKSAQAYSDWNAKGLGPQDYATDQRAAEGQAQIASREKVAEANRNQRAPRFGTSPLSAAPTADAPFGTSPLSAAPHAAPQAAPAPATNGDNTPQGLAEQQHIQNQMNPFANGVPAPPAGYTPGSGLPPQLAEQLYKAAGGDHQLAAKLAKQAGW